MTDVERTDAELLTAARAWLAQDPDDETRAELSTLIDSGAAGESSALAALHDRFDSRLAFGTAGLRGEIAAGPNRMNRVLVSQAAAGLAAFLLARTAGDSQPSIVIGYDGRKNSAVFASDTAEIMAAAGIRAILLPRLLPTPLVAFAVRHLDVSAGVMVTASHNPPNDNGYKVYLGGADEGSQIVSPVDADIAKHILRVAAEANVLELPRSDRYEIAPESVIEAYVAQTAALASRPAKQPKVVYTAMHGVGWQTFRSVLEAAGFDEPAVVRQQIEPDSAFPTVAFPNPEEPGALDLAFETAREVDADLVIANDPDADRLAVAIRDTSQPAGFRALTGNEVGALLGWRAAEILDAAAHDEQSASGTLACSIVSSPALRAIATEYGLEFVETLTGFKWVSRTPGLVFGFEEALGYLVNPATVRDKDGISAALALLDVASRLAARGLTLSDQLDAFSMRFGQFASSQVSVRVTDLSQITRVMARLRAEPPAEIGGIRVFSIDDLLGAGGALPSSDVLRIHLDDGSRVMVRPSGTEPKLKVYLDTQSSDGSLEERRAAATTALSRLEEGVRTLIAD
ncbi:phospho-sugar mutase [Agreia sp.]|uniref:phospho-sugar mutase n=1 Tax=Agreia sp. TaxID=1872416 RepID=UPI0035BC46F1